ncbi:Uncharacterized protein yae1 [Cytospora mali]|uniref:Protein YAE1 n=1 Tax=Cytospora mali TaxID=578113 RepID=A0A194W1S4_CYTMA|nr:Uncharacterized protein yae1 [Valsa mali]
MLLRQSEPADADHYISAVAMSPPEPLSQDTSTPRVDPLDDVFGSDAGDADDHGSPVVFGDGDGDDEDDLFSQVHIPGGRRGHHHPSDIHRLRQEHTTAGYREGITVAKASSVQAGFDEGFGLGATIGLKVGYLLGVLEGVAGALSSRSAASLSSSSSSSSSSAPPGSPPPPHEGEAAAAGRQLLADASVELGVRSVFSEAYWHSDGTWKYEVVGGERDGDEEEGEVLFSHVAEAHPLVRKWTGLVEGEMRRWGLREQLPLLQRREGEEGAAVEAVARVKAVVQTQPDAKAASDALSW